MGIIELKYNNKTITTKSQILKILKEEQLYWLIDSEVESAIIEIKKHTVIWHGGNYNFGNWHYGIFKNGEFKSYTIYSMLKNEYEAIYHSNHK